MNMPMWPQTLSPGSSVPHHHHPEIYHDNTLPPITVILTAFLLALFFLGFFAIYFCRCVLDGIFSAFNNRHPPPGIPIAPANPDPPGLDPSIINTFPTFSYSSVKDYRREDYGLECAICLCEFEDDDILRLLTKCCHVFHQSCIDLWLGSHISCPVCRCLLDPSDEKSPEKPVEIPGTPLGDEDETTTTTVEIVIKGDEEGSSSSSNIGVASTSNANTVNDEDDTLKGQNNKMNNITGVGRFSRSHSTGHSIGERSSRHGMGIEEGRIQDKYTLRLPQEVKERITRRHMQTLSCTTFGAVYENDVDDECGWVGQIYNGGGFGEISRDKINCSNTHGDVNRV